MKTKKFLFLLLVLLNTYLSFSQNKWDGLTNEQLSGNIFNYDSSGYTFNFGNLYPESNLDPIVMNCAEIKEDIHDPFNTTKGVEYTQTEYIDSSKYGKGSLKYTFRSGIYTAQFSSFFSTQNCSRTEAKVNISTIKSPKIRAMVKASEDCYLKMYGLEKTKGEKLIWKKVESKNSHYVKLFANQWTEVEYEITDTLTPSYIYGIIYQVVGNAFDGYYSADGHKSFNELKIYVDWAEVGNDVGHKISNSPHKTHYVNKWKFLHNYLGQNLATKDYTGYTFNFGTFFNEKNLHVSSDKQEVYKKVNCLYSNYPSDSIGGGAHNITKEKGITTSISKTEGVDQHFMTKGSLVYSFDGTQKQEGYVSSKFYENNCTLLERSRNYLNLLDKKHRKIRAMVKTTKDTYFRIFAITGSVYSMLYYKTIKYSNIDSTDVFNRPILLKANEWTEVEFPIQQYTDDSSLVVDFSEIIGLTFSVTNHVDETKATGFPVDLYIDWVETGSVVGKSKTKTNSFLANNTITDVSLEYNFSNTDTVNYSFEKINCLPINKTSNQNYNITKNQNVTFSINQNTQIDNDLDGSLAMNFKNSSNEWVINRFSSKDCKPTNLNLTNDHLITFTIKPSENIKIKVATVILDDDSYYINDTLNSVKSLNLEKNI